MSAAMKNSGGAISTARESLATMSFAAPPVVKTIQQRAFGIGVFFAIFAGIGAFLQPQQFFRAYLLGYVDWLGVSLGSMALLMITYMTDGVWGKVAGRQLGAAMRCIPLMTILFLPILFGLPRLYIWARPLDGITDKKFLAHLQSITQSYLNPHGFILRAIIYFTIWNIISFFLSKWSAEFDHPPMRNGAARFKKLSAPGLVLYAFTMGFASIDWLMSMDPSWISTMYGLIILIGQLLSAMAMVVVIEAILAKYRPMTEMLKPSYVHDHGKWMLAFIMVHAYFSFSQWLIIWAGNLPDEITWYMRRIHGGWGYVGVFLVLFHFAVPFVILLSRSIKRNIQKMFWVALWLLFICTLDLFWIIEPNFSVTFTVTWLDIVVPVAIGGLWLGTFAYNLGSRPLLPAYEVHSEEILEPVHGGH